MPRYRIALAAVEKRLPPGATFPPALRTFASTLEGLEAGSVGWFDVGYTSTKVYVDIVRVAHAHLLPFIHMPCGDLVVLWWEGEVTEAPKVVHIGAHGDAPRVHASVEVFLANLIAAKTGAPDLDEGTATRSARAGLLTPKAIKATKRAKAPVAEVRAARPSAADAKRFTVWITANTPKKAELDPVEMEKIRKRLVAVLRRENAALPAQHRARRGAYVHWNLYLVRRTGAVDWISQGRNPFPAAHEVRPLLERIAVVTGQKDKEIKVVVTSKGTLFPDRRTTIDPPAKKR